MCLRLEMRVMVVLEKTAKVILTMMIKVWRVMAMSPVVAMHQIQRQTPARFAEETFTLVLMGKVMLICWWRTMMMMRRTTC